ncbi:MAG: hypothetical protein IJ729_04560, partial [Alloprevotella sp.]|nr:hypothetical protein [Alloprevotella sp.]
HVLTMAATAFGEFTYVPLHLMLYRRYEGAVTGRTDRTLRERLGNFFQRGKTVLDARHYRGVVAFYEANKEFLAPEQADIFHRFFRYKGRSRLSNALHILPDGFKLYGKSAVLIIKLLLRPLL